MAHHRGLWPQKASWGPRSSFVLIQKIDFGAAPLDLVIHLLDYLFDHPKRHQFLQSGFRAIDFGSDRLSNTIQR